MRLDKIYTKQGDGGRTSLVGGERIRKSSLRIEAVGTVDELNSFVGVIRTVAEREAGPEIAAETEQALKQIQNDLFDIGSLLAMAPEHPLPGLRELRDEQVAALERRIDAYQEILEALPSFVLPGGNLLNAHAHVARTVCRRAERAICRLHEEEPVADTILKYINRLSDYLFVYSRWVSRKADTPEYLWDKPLA